MAFNGIIWLMTVEIRMKIKNRSQGWPRPRHEHKYTKYKLSQYNNDGYTYSATPKKHLKLNSSKS